MTRRSTRSPTRPASTRIGASGGLWRSALATRLATARSRRPGSARIAGRDSGTSTSTRSNGSERLDSAAATTSSQPTATRVTCRTPVSRRLMSSRLPTRALSRSVSSSMVVEELVGRVRCPVDVVLQEAGHRRLDRGQRGAEVVRHASQQGGAQGVGLGGDHRRGGLGPQSPLLEGRGELGDEGVEHPLVVGVERTPRQHQARRVVQLHDLPPADGGRRLVLGRITGRWTAGGPLLRPRLGAGVERLHGRALESEGGAQPVEHRRHRVVRRRRVPPATRASASASAEARRPASSRRAPAVTSDRDDHAHHDEAGEGEGVLGLGDGQRVVGLGEVPVEDQRAGDRSRDAGSDAADRRGQDDEHEEGHQIAGQGEVVPERHQRERRAAACRGW